MEKKKKILRQKIKKNNIGVENNLEIEIKKNNLEMENKKIILRQK